ncbi:P-loop containing nucleoside triphosphate hydrolase protein [Phaeosphaeriaceae sp. SRC1lsM3a]|nr:P-loop containing nucleoside triphosphate hydrolase protein [Stagonospora sp. SRC1lsM3a]
MPVRYRVDFFLRTMYGNEDTFLRSKSWNTPTIIHSSGPDGDFSEVLEEIHHIVFGRKESYVQKKIDDFPDSVLTLGPDDTIKPKKLHIRSPLLLNALRSVVKYSSNPPLHDNVEPFVDGIWSFPFKELYHHRAELLDFQKQPGGARANHTAEENADCNRHIDILIDYLDHEPTVQLMLAKEQWVQKVPTTTFAGFWLLLKPGADVYVREYGQLNAYVVDLVFGGMNYESRSLRAENYRVHVWHLIFNGKTIKRRSKTIEIPVFDGERDIVSLPVFPTSFHDRLDGGRLRHELIKRGDNFFRYAKGPTFLEYSGIGMKQGAKKYNRARVVIEHQSLPWTLPEFSGTGAWFLSSSDTTEEVYRHDTSGFARPPPLPPMYHGGSYPGVGAIRGPGSRARVPRCECSQCKLVDSRTGTSISPTFSDYDSIDPRQAMGLSQHQALVCMSHMFGFILKDRAYDILDVNGLTEPIVAENAIDELVMRPEKNKETIKAIVKTYTDTNGQADLMGVDFIRGKGEGQIFLLHGPPGTGKTLTAESVAEYTKRPLLSITAADLGHDPVELERNLLRFFKNATAWDAIVLLDEADIYLERRSSKDLRRNSIVSIFLRALDYFEGIIFFTTNRVGHFDEAFMSRIHVAVGYDPLDDKAREQIWDTFFKKLKDNHRNGGPKIDYDYDAKQYVRKSEDVKNLQWNGREIRNAFQTALALAIADSKAARQKNRPEVDCVPLLTEAHLSQVVHMSAAFKTYIKATHEGMNESDLAFRLGNRYDEHENNNH